jgi:Family of unknown function (DUF6492)
MSTSEIAIVTPSFARDYELCRALNESVLRFVPAPVKHYIFVDRCDLALFRRLQGPRTVIAAIEEILPPGFFKAPYSKKWWVSIPARYPAKGWLVQQLAKLSATHVLEERVVVNMDSDVRFIRPVDLTVFAQGGRTRLYRKPGGIVDGMKHVTWHHNVCALLGIEADDLPMDDYVGNVISWDRRVALNACARVEAVTGLPWHVAFTRRRRVSEYLLYGLYVDKVAGPQAAGIWVDERSWCHTYWGPEPLLETDVEAFAAALKPDDVAFSIAGYTATDDRVVQTTLRLITERVSSSQAVTVEV